MVGYSRSVMREALVESCRCYQNRVCALVSDEKIRRRRITYEWDPRFVVILSRFIEFMCEIGSAAEANFTSRDETHVALLYSARGDGQVRIAQRHKGGIRGG